MSWEIIEFFKVTDYYFSGLSADTCIMRDKG